MLIRVPNCGRAGVIRDLSQHELPIEAWSDAQNVRFLDGYCQQFLGHGSAYGAPNVVPYHVLPVFANGRRYWIYLGAEKAYAVTDTSGSIDTTNLTPTETTQRLAYNVLPLFGQPGTAAGMPPAAGAFDGLRAGTLNNARSTHQAAPSFALSALQPGTLPANAPSDMPINLVLTTVTQDDNYRATPNQWTSTLLSGIPIINAGNAIDYPQRWDLDEKSRFQRLDNWPDNTYCKSLRSFKNFLVALNITRDGKNLPFMVKWSSPAEPGSVPSTWDESDETQDAGETDLAESNGQIVDGLPLRDFFMIYKEDSIWRMTYTGGPAVFAFQKVLGTSGALNRNCIVEFDGYHFVLTGSDVIVHDGQQSSSILDKQARRALFQDFDASATDRCFVFKNPFLNEIFVCYPQAGASIPNRAMVYNYRDKTVSYRDLPDLHHANFGTLGDDFGDTWEADGDPWDSDMTTWGGPGFTPNTTRVLMASNDQQLYLLDSSATYDGVKPTSYVERVGLPLGASERVKLVRGIRPRISGTEGGTVRILVAGMNDPYETPNYTKRMTHTIGKTVSNDCMVSGRYLAIRFEIDGGNTAYFWRLDSYDVDVVDAGGW